MDCNENIAIKMILKFQKRLPKSRYIFLIFIILKYIPLIMLTNDIVFTEITIISKLLFNMTLNCWIGSYIDTTFYEIIFYISIFLTLLPLVTFYLVYRSIKKYGKMSKNVKKIFDFSCLYSFYLLFFFSQYIGELFVNSLFCVNTSENVLDTMTLGTSKVNFSTYYKNNYLVFTTKCRSNYKFLISIFGLFFFLLINLQSIFIFKFINEPVFYSSNPISLNFNYPTKYVYLGLINCYFVFERNYDINYTFYVKLALRSIIALFYLIGLKSKITRFYSSKLIFYMETYIQSFCISSVFIEYFTLFDISIYNSSNFIILKLIFQCFLAYITIKYLITKEEKILGKIFSNKFPLNFNFYNKFFFHLFSIKAFNMVFYKNIFSKFSRHKQKCKNNECVCQKADLDFQNFHEIIKSFKNMKESGVRTNKEIADFYIKNKFFSFLFDYLEQKIYHEVNKLNNQHTIEYTEYTMVYILFQFYFKNNYLSAMYYAEKLCSGIAIQNNFSMKLLLYNIKKRLIKEYIQNQSKKKDFLNIYNKFQEFKNYYILESNIKKNLKEIIKMLSFFKKENLSITEFSDSILAFQKFYKFNEKIIKIMFKVNKCWSNMITARLLFYFNFLINDFPQSLEKYINNRQSLEVNLKEQENTYYMMIQCKSEGDFVITYCSYYIQLLLGYKTNEIINMEFHTLLPPEIGKLHRNYLFHIIHNYNTVINNKKVFLLNKNRDAINFYFDGTVVLSLENEIRIFGTFKPLLDNEKIDTCFLLCNNTGNIIANNSNMEKYFAINSKVISILNINFFTDFLLIPEKELKNLVEFLKENSQIKMKYEDLLDKICTVDHSKLREIEKEELWNFGKETKNSLIRRFGNSEIEIKIEERTLLKEKFFFIFIKMKKNKNSDIYYQETEPLTITASTFLFSDPKIFSNLKLVNYDYPKDKRTPFKKEESIPKDSRPFLKKSKYQIIFSKEYKLMHFQRQILILFCLFALYLGFLIFFSVYSINLIDISRLHYECYFQLISLKGTYYYSMSSLLSYIISYYNYEPSNVFNFTGNTNRYKELLINRTIDLISNIQNFEITYKKLTITDQQIYQIYLNKNNSFSYLNLDWSTYYIDSPLLKEIGYIHTYFLKINSSNFNSLSFQEQFLFNKFKQNFTTYAKELDLSVYYLLYNSYNYYYSCLDQFSSGVYDYIYNYNLRLKWIIFSINCVNFAAILVLIIFKFCIFLSHFNSMMNKYLENYKFIDSNKEILFNKFKYMLKLFKSLNYNTFKRMKSETNYENYKIETLEKIEPIIIKDREETYLPLISLNNSEKRNNNVIITDESKKSNIRKKTLKMKRMSKFFLPESMIYLDSDVNYPKTNDVQNNTNEILKTKESNNPVINKNQVTKPKSFYVIIYFFILISIIILIIILINLWTTFMSFSQICYLHEYSEAFLERIPKICQMNLIIRQSLIENRIIKDKNNYCFFEQYNNEFVNLTNKINSITLVNDNVLQNTLKYEIAFNDDSMCETYAKYYVNNILQISNENLTNLEFKECLLSGNKINTKGIQKMFNLIYNNLQEVNNDFNELYKTDPNVSSNHFIERISDPALLSSNQNIEYILSKLNEIYKKLVYDDSFTLYDYITTLHRFLNYITLFSIITTILVYFIFYWFRIRKNESMIDFFEKMILNSLNY